MNIFRSLMGKVWNDSNSTELVKITSGQLYIVRTDPVRSSRECIYNDAMATIRRAPSMEHHFQLVITRVYEEGDEELLEDEEETDQEKVFLIDVELEFRTGTTIDGEPNFAWRDLQGDVDELYEFVSSDANDPTRALFETCMYRAMYERKYKRSAEALVDADFQEFIWKPKAKKTKSQPRSDSSNQGDAASLTTAMEWMTVRSKSPPSSAPASPTRPPPSQQRTASDDHNHTALTQEEAELYLWNFNQGQFIKEADVVAKILFRPTAGFQYWMTASTSEGQLLAHRVSSEMNVRWSTKLTSLTWNNLSENGNQSSWCFRFSSTPAYEHFKSFFSQAVWETLHQASWAKVKADEQAYVLSSANEDVEMRDVEDDDEDEANVERDLEEGSEDEDEEEEEEYHPEEQPSDVPAGKNEQLTVGYKGDRAFVVRGNNIGVFKHTNDRANPMEYTATIKKLSTPKGKEFKPGHMMLHEQDSKMVLMNPGEPHALFSLDIEHGKIVEEWKVHDDITVDHIAPDSKFAQTTPGQTLVGASHNALFRIDPRLSGNKMVDSQYKQYASKNEFSGVTTTASGKLAVASEKGDIRLFDSIGKIAKTALQPLGDPIIGIDVTANGRWIVATTKTYLLLIDTLIGDGKYAGQLGFDKSFPKEAKPIPKRLQLRAEHVAYMNHNLSFSPARFNMGEGQEENAIITSTGRYVIAWDFAKVKKGQVDKYEIKKYEDDVVQDNFKFGDDKEIIVALTNNVIAVNKKQLKKPTRISLAPNRDLQSHSSIVNSPY